MQGAGGGRVALVGTHGSQDKSLMEGCVARGRSGAARLMWRTQRQSGDQQ